MVAEGHVDFSLLISHRIGIERAAEAYALLEGREPTLGIMLEYPRVEAAESPDVQCRTVQLRGREVATPGEAPAIGFIGTGSFGTQVLIPAFRNAGANLIAAASLPG
jgi:hypothetical protein